MFHVWGLVSLILFYLVIFLMGIFAAWKLKKNNMESESEDVMLAGRSLGLVVGMFSMTATWVDGGYINGAAESVFSKGIVWCQGPIGYSLSLIIAGMFYATKMRDAGYVTMLDPFYLKYGKYMTALLYVPSMLGDVLCNGAILSALGATVATIIELDVKISIIVSGAIAVIYTLCGGMYSVTYTDVIELVCIFVGVWLCVPFCMTNEAVGSFSEAKTSFWGEVPTLQIGKYIDGFLLLILGGIPWQVYFQRVLASKSSRTARIVSYVAGVWCIILAIPPIIIGAVARVTDWGMAANMTYPTDDRMVSMILPLSLLHLTPLAVAYIGLGAVAAAVMSSSDAAVLSSSSQFCRIVYKNVFRPQASDREMLWVMRVAMIFFGFVATCISLTVETIYGLWYLAGDLVYVILFPQLTCILFLEKHCNVWGSLASYVVCVFLRLIFGEHVVEFPALVKLPLYDYETNEQLFPFKTAIVIVGFAVLLGVSKLTNLYFPTYTSSSDSHGSQFPVLTKNNKNTDCFGEAHTLSTLPVKAFENKAFE